MAVAKAVVEEHKSKGSGRDGESPPHPPVRTRRADFPHRAPQNRSVAQARHD